MKPKKTKASRPSPARSANKSRYKHHRKVPRENAYKVDNYSDASLSESNENGYEYERPANDDDNDDAYIGSESETSAPGDRFSSQLRDPDSQSINLSTTAFPNSTSNFPKISQPPSTHLASYMNIAPFPIFHGNPNECPVKHVSRFAKVCVANNVSTTDMMMRIFPVTLEDEAALWYDLNIEPYSSLTGEEIKSSFLHAYHKIEVVDQLRSELMMINQGDEESVRSYFLRLQWILKQWPDHGIPDGLLKGLFIDGLREEFRGWIIPQKPDSLHEALRLAFGFEQVKSIRAVRKELKCGFCDGMHEERDCEVRERMRKLWRESKEKEEAVVLADSTRSDDELGKELMRSVSIGASSSVGKNNEGEEAGFMDGKKNQFQYGKYQRWMKKLERNNSLISAIPNAE